MARNRYIEEPTTPLDTFVLTSGFAFLFGGMFIGLWLVNNLIVGLVAGLMLFVGLFAFYVHQDRTDVSSEE